uniref:pentatricopeptide repeat-containing protein At4g33170-like n=1 Tax=Fragaria vesca subsp. vesca TaxID=101020 RepID=UPI0005C88C64|nr:PREDICTED: pentatricopeptide repeat-containing protein At4g33170-like [Fragaria vesca subsp. vesca]
MFKISTPKPPSYSLMASKTEIQIQPDPPPPPNSGDPRAIYARAIRTHSADRSLHNHLITLCSKSTPSSFPLRLFSQISIPNVVSWTALISSQSNTLAALRHFISMLRHPTSPNQRTFATLFKTCASLSFLSFGLSLHSLSLKLGLSSEPYSGSALIHFYSKCGMPVYARKVLDEIPQRDRDAVCYGAAIVGLAQNSRPIDALSAFADMKCRDVASSMYTVSGALRAAAELAALEQCRIIHTHVVVMGLDGNVVVGTSLLDAYGKSGMVCDARQVFDESNSLGGSLVGCNAMLAAYAQQGDKDSALELFYKMEGRGLVPDEYSFLAILMCLGNAGLVLETDWWLKRMKADYGLEPVLEHYTCLVGAMGRAGQLEDAERAAMTIPIAPDAAVWRTLLTCAAYHKSPDLARSMAKRLLEIDPQDDSAYVIVANVLSSAGKWDEVAEVRMMMKDRRVKKEGGRSWIEVRGEVHVFLAGDRRHQRIDEIYAKVAELMEGIEKLGYVPLPNEMLHGVGEQEKKEALWYHSEKLAVAFGVVSAPPGKPLRIVKNLRICRDCHEAFKYMCWLLEREIIVRDVNRYHIFSNGRCNCGEMW